MCQPEISLNPTLAMAVLVASLALVGAFACTTEKIVYVLPDGTEVAPTADGDLQTVSSQIEEATAQTALSLTATAIARRKDRLIKHIIENRPPMVTGYGLHRSQSFRLTPDCAKLYYHYGSIFSGIPPHFGYSVPAQGVSSVVIDCDDDGNAYFTELDERYVDMLWEYLGGE